MIKLYRMKEEFVFYFFKKRICRLLYLEARKLLSWVGPVLLKPYSPWLRADLVQQQERSYAVRAAGSRAGISGGSS